MVNWIHYVGLCGPNFLINLLTAKAALSLSPKQIYLWAQIYGGMIDKRMALSLINN